VEVTHISRFRKIKFWAAIRYGNKSKGIIIQEKVGEGKMNVEEYLEEIFDKELFDFWMEGMEDRGQLYVMEDRALYHKSVASIRRKQLEEDGW